MTRWDAVIIGGGLAGSSAAIRLAQAGQKVLLLEKENTCHPKVCGEFISVEAQHYLAQLGIDIDKLGASLISHIRFTRGNATAKLKLPFQAQSLSRDRLDAQLLSVAEASGAEIRYGALATQLAYESPDWRVSTPHEELRAQHIFLATGKHELRGWERPHRSSDNMIGFKMHMRLTAEQREALLGQVELFLCKGGYVGLELVEKELANLCLLVSKDYFASCGSLWQKLLRAYTNQTPLLALRLQGASPLWAKPLAISRIPLGWVYRKTGQEPPGLYRLGDQMAVIPPFCGDGMSIALHTASAAVKHSLQMNASSYHDIMRHMLTPQMRYAQALSYSFHSTLLQKLVVPLCKMPGVLPWAIRKTRVDNLIEVL